MKIPAKYRQAVYWTTLVVTVVATVAGALGVIPADAVNRGAETATQVLAVISAILAIGNITPDD